MTETEAEPRVTDAADPRAGRAALDELMRAAQAGDGRAYRALLEEVALRMRRLVCARAPWLGRADVEDIVQDILLALHTARATWDPARPFMPWTRASRATVWPTMRGATCGVRPSTRRSRTWPRSSPPPPGRAMPRAS